MHVIATSGKYIVCCGRHLVFVFTKRHSSPHFFVMDTKKAVVRQGVPAVARGSLVCLDISRNTRFICVADSEKHAYVFERVGDNHWDFQYSFETEKRCEKVMFDVRSTAIILLDKSGDVWMTNMVVSEMQTPVRIFSPGVQILDCIISCNNREIILADHDNKLMTGKLPTLGSDITISSYLIGHQSPVVSVGFVEQEHVILSADMLGNLKLWSRNDLHCIGTYNFLSVCEITGRQGDANSNDGEVLSVKVTEALDSIWIASKVSGRREFPILRLKHALRELKKVSQVKMDSEFCDFTWNQESLFVYSVEGTEVLKKFDVTTHGLMCDARFRVPSMMEYSHDLKAFTLFNKHLRASGWVSGQSSPRREGNETPPQMLRQSNSRFPFGQVRRSVSFADSVPEDDDEDEDADDVVAQSILPSRSIRRSSGSSRWRDFQ